MVLVEKKAAAERHADKVKQGEQATGTTKGQQSQLNRVSNNILQVNDLLDPTPKPPNYQDLYDKNNSAHHQRILKYGAVRDDYMKAEETPGQTPQDQDATQKQGHVPEIVFNIAEFL